MWALAKAVALVVGVRWEFDRWRLVGGIWSTMAIARAAALAIALAVALAAALAAPRLGAPAWSVGVASIPYTV